MVKLDRRIKINLASRGHFNDVLTVDLAIGRDVDHRVAKKPGRATQAPSPLQHVCIVGLLQLRRGG